MESIFKVQPPNLKQHSGIIDNSQNIFKIDYAPYLNRWFSRRTVSLNNSTEQELILINLYIVSANHTYHMNLRKHQNHSMSKERNLEQ
jgi:hypothetical protein